MDLIEVSKLCFQFLRDSIEKKKTDFNDQLWWYRLSFRMYLHDGLNFGLGNK
jgi:hypothetical protein